MASFSKIPLEVYPLAAMMSVALCLGGYTGYKHIAHGQDMRLGASSNKDVQNWQARVEKVNDKPRFGNFFYGFLAEA
ncbi:hypothetical protein HDU98_003082 [Podochytrium sp. JEL0797]|nr:hypothetical protein HDU98_003082 [Podochytrium sp. JEL0797]